MNRLNQTVGGPPVSDPARDGLHDIFPDGPFNTRADARVPHDQNLVLEKAEEQKNACAVPGLEHLFRNECLSCPLGNAEFQKVVSREQPFQRGNLVGGKHPQAQPAEGDDADLEGTEPMPGFREKMEEGDTDHGN